jgi:hypothetical protein
MALGTIVKKGARESAMSAGQMTKDDTISEIAIFARLI